MDLLFRLWQGVERLEARCFLETELCLPHGLREARAADRPAVGSLSMKIGKTQGYVLTFRCINCGKFEVFAKYPTEGLEPEDRVRGRLYQVSCESCGCSRER